jgi:hypothetical protein
LVWADIRPTFPWVAGHPPSLLLIGTLTQTIYPRPRSLGLSLVTPPFPTAKRSDPDQRDTEHEQPEVAIRRAS